MSFGVCLTGGVLTAAEAHGGGSGTTVSQTATPPAGGCPNGAVSYTIPDLSVTTGDVTQVFHNSLTGQTETAHMTGTASLEEPEGLIHQGLDDAQGKL